MAEGGTICAACTCFVLLPSVILIILSFATLEPIEYGLNFNAITMSLENATYSVAGLYFLGFGHWFIRFPRVIQTIEFMASGENNLLHTRTADGLPLTLGLSFQYRYQPNTLHALYLKYNGAHLPVYINVATAEIANVACNYTAYTFFNDKQGIGVAMQAALNKKFTEELFAQIDALQINQVELPTSFQDAILQSISTKQNITRSVRYKENMQVTFATQRMVAENVANQTVIEARGVANKKIQQAKANAQMTVQTVSAEMAAFGNLTQSLAFGSNDGLDYLWWDTLHSAAAGSSGAAGKEFLVGLDPAAYIKGGPTGGGRH